MELIRPDEAIKLHRGYEPKIYELSEKQKD